MDQGGLGDLLHSGMNTHLTSQVLTASVLCVIIAVVAGLLLLALQRLPTPWSATTSPGRGQAA